MTAGGRYFERALGAFLALDVGEIGGRSARFQNRGLRARQDLRAFEMIGELDQRACGDDLDLRAGLGRFGSGNCRTDQALAPRIRPDRRRKHAGDGGD